MTHAASPVARERGRAPDTASAHGVEAPATHRFLWPVTVLVLLVLAVAAAGSWRDLAAQRREEARLEAAIAATEARIAALELRIEAIRTDPVALDRLARRELGWIAPGDVVFVFPEDGVSPAGDLSVATSSGEDAGSDGPPPASEPPP